MILKKLVEKAEKNHKGKRYILTEICKHLAYDFTITGWDVRKDLHGISIEYRFCYYDGDIDRKGVTSLSLSDVLFNHDFMRAVCGDESTCENCGTLESAGYDDECIYCISGNCHIYYVPGYLYNICKLAKLATNEQRLDYMKQFVEDE